MGIFSDFRKFALRGNVIDLAVGIIIGAAFTKIVNSLVTDILTPPLGLLQGGTPFKDWKIPLTSQPVGEEGEVAAILIGQFIQTLIDFAIVALAIFLLVQGIKRAQQAFERKAEEDAKEAEALAPPENVLLLREIRDLLKKDV